MDDILNKKTKSSNNFYWNESLEFLLNYNNNINIFKDEIQNN